VFLRRKTAGAVLAAAAAVGLTTAAALPASASATNYFELAVQVGTFAPVMCLQPINPAGGAGAAIVQQPCSAGNQAQNWAPVNTAGSTYEFVNQVSGMCLDARGGAAIHTPIQQWQCNGGSSEKWWLPSPNVPQGSLSTYTNYRTNKCLDVPNQTVFQSSMQEYNCFDGMDNVAQVFTIP